MFKHQNLEEALKHIYTRGSETEATNNEGVVFSQIIPV